MQTCWRSSKKDCLTRFNKSYHNQTKKTHLMSATKTTEETNIAEPKKVVYTARAHTIATTYSNPAPHE